MKLSTLVGRKRELGLLGETLLGSSGPGAEIGGAALLVGDAGIGKTRLVAELAERALDRGALPVWGRCWDTADAPPYWPWTQVVRAIQRERSGARETSPAADLATIVLDEPAEAERFELFDAVTRLLDEAARRRPLLIVLDDVHRADAPSLLLARFALHHLRDAPLAFVATSRPVDADDEIGELLGQLPPDVVRVDVAGLDVDDVAELLGDRDHAAEVQALTGGNPFHIEQVIRSGGITHPYDLDPRRHAAGLRVVVADRIRRTPGATRVALGFAALSRPPSSIGEVAALLDDDPRHVAALLEPAVAAGLAELDDAELSLPHALVGDAALVVLADTVGPERVEALHRRAAERIRDDPDRLGELAHHLLRAGAEHVGAAIDACCAAADHATAALAHEDAIVHLERALRVVSDDSGHANDRCRLLLALGRARSSVGRRADAEHAFDLAREIAESLDDPELRAEAAIGDFVRYEFAGDRPARRERSCRRALGDLPSDDDPLRARVLASLACTLVTGPALDEGRSVASDALAMARRLDDPAAIAEALVAEQVTHLGPDGLGRRLDGARELIALARRADLRPFVLQGRFFLMGALLERGDVRELEVELQAQRDTLAHLADPRLGRHTLWFQCTRALLDGRPGDAEALAAECLRIAEELGDPDGIGVFGGQLGVIRWMQDRLLEMEPIFEERRTDQPDEPLWSAVLAYVWAHHGRADAARGALASIGDLRDVRLDLHWLLTMTTAAEAAVLVDDRARIATARDLLLPYVDRCVPAAMGAVVWGTVARPLGLAALALGHVDEGISHLARAVGVSARLRARPWLVEAQLDLAEALLANGRRDDARLPGLLAEARATAEQLDLRRWTERAGRLAGRLGSAPAVPAASATSTTPAIAVLGTFEVTTSEGERATWNSRKARELLKILVARRGTPVHREQLMDLLWPDVAPDDLRNRLSVALSTVRRTIDPARRFASNELVDADRTTVRLDLDRVEVDAERFAETARRALDAHRSGADETDSLLAEALTLHRGEALPDEPYADWATPLRNEVRALYLQVARAAGQRAVASGDRLGAWEAYRRLVEADPDAADARDALGAAVRALDDP